MQLRTRRPRDPFTRVRDITVEGTRLGGWVGRAAVLNFVYFRDNVRTPTCHQLDSPLTILSVQKHLLLRPLSVSHSWTPVVSSVSSPLVLRMGLSKTPLLSASKDLEHSRGSL